MVRNKKLYLLKNKKAQLLSEPFTYIMALVVIAMIVGFGFWIITKTTKLGNQVDITKFKQDFTNKINEIKLLSPGSGENYGDKPEQGNVPVGIKVICFVDMTKGTISSSSSIQNYNDIKGDMEVLEASHKTNQNVFFGMSTAQYPPIPSLSIPKLIPNPNPLCVEIKMGKLKVGLENKGKNVEVSAMS